VRWEERAAQSFSSKLDDLPPPNPLDFEEMASHLAGDGGGYAEAGIFKKVTFYSRGDQEDNYSHPPHS
jgi:hypothetical protein